MRVVITALVVVATGLALAVSGGTAGESQTCKGIPPTTNSLNGTNGHDVIIGTNNADEINAKGGNDLVCGKRGDDTILAGTGNDLVLANAGNDEVDAGEGDDKAKGNAGDDGFGCVKCDAKLLINGGIFGGPGNDVVGGGTGDDVVSGEEDDDTNRCAAGFDLSPDQEGVNTYESCELSPQQGGGGK